MQIQSPNSSSSSSISTGDWVALPTMYNLGQGRYILQIHANQGKHYMAISLTPGGCGTAAVSVSDLPPLQTVATVPVERE